MMHTDGGHDGGDLPWAVASERIRLDVPALPQYARLARLAASGVALRHGLPYEEVEAWRSAIDRALGLLLAAGPDADLRLAVTFELAPAHIAAVLSRAPQSSAPGATDGGAADPGATEPPSRRAAAGAAPARAANPADRPGGSRPPLRLVGATALDATACLEFSQSVAGLVDRVAVVPATASIELQKRSWSAG